MSSDRIPMTRVGYDKIKAEVDHLQSVELPKVLEGLAAARAEGDLSENAEYHGRRESHAMLEARIGAIRDKLSRAVLVDPSQFPKDQVSFGCTVVVKDLEFGDEEEFTLVGAGEEDYDTGKILITSPLAQGLNGEKIGERVEIAVPQGKLRFEVLAIRPIQAKNCSSKLSNTVATERSETPAAKRLIVKTSLQTGKRPSQTSDC